MNLIIACLAAGLLSVAVRFVWFHPNVFGTAWNKEIGRTTTTAGKSQLLTFLVSFVICAYFAYEMNWINHPDDLNFFVHGMYHGAKNIGVFAVGAVLIHAVSEQRSPAYILAHAGYWLVTFALIGGLLASFPAFK